MNPDCEPELAISGGAPIGLQVETQIRDCIVTGRLNPGEQLPTVRGIAVELGINPGLVEGAYRQLEGQGFLTSEDGSGTFVALLPEVQALPPEYREHFERLCREFLAQAARYGYSSAEVVRALEALTQGRTWS